MGASGSKATAAAATIPVAAAAAATEPSSSDVGGDAPAPAPTSTPTPTAPAAPSKAMKDGEYPPGHEVLLDGDSGQLLYVVERFLADLETGTPGVN